MKQRGRPKGRVNDSKASFGPLADLIRKTRLERGLGLAEVAKSCQCSVQFISNIEHGRAPLPWEKLPLLSHALKIQAEDLQAANFAIRSDFQSFVKTSRTKTMAAANTFAITTKDKELQEVIRAYHDADSANRKRFVKTAMKLLTEPV